MIKSCSLAESTKKVREGQWACYLRFCKRFKLSPYCSSAHQASLYATFLSKSMVYSSICNYLHAVVYFHNLSGIKPPCLSAAELRTTLLGIKRRSRHNVNVKSPVYPRHLLSMFTAVQSKHELIVYVASLLLFRCLLRVSHVTRSPHELKWSDVTFHGWGITVHVTSSKTNQYGTYTCDIPVSKVPDKRLCVSHWLRLFRKESGCVSQFVFRQDGVRLSYTVFLKTLKALALRARIDVPNLGSHSFRRGGAAFLASLGMPLASIKDRGNWRSSCVFRYLQEPFEAKVSGDKWVASHLSCG